MVEAFSSLLKFMWHEHELNSERIIESYVMMLSQIVCKNWIKAKMSTQEAALAHTQNSFGFSLQCIQRVSISTTQVCILHFSVLCRERRRCIHEYAIRDDIDDLLAVNESYIRVRSHFTFIECGRS